MQAKAAVLIITMLGGVDDVRGVEVVGGDVGVGLEEGLEIGGS